MTNREDVRAFLMSRRANVTPEDVGLHGDSNRRVPGLRRNEVAVLAGVSVEYYSRVERGNLAGVSDAVLDALAEALRLDDAERAHLFDLSGAANASPVRRSRRAPAQTVPASMAWTLEAVTRGAAFIRNNRLDIVAENALMRGLYNEAYSHRERPVNLARFAFLQRDLAEQFYVDWDAAADLNVGLLRTEAGKSPHDKALHDLIGELGARSDDFRQRWAAHDVRVHTNGPKLIRHSVVGDLDLVFQSFDAGIDPGLHLVTYTAAPGSPSEQSLALLATWVATNESENATSTLPQ
ncbi:helix-turn-helix transcriptional regulator [Herbiconiux sp. CPCC 203407]|uniref:Helix-turn-helix transcriptional regulator n=1 Tax=Herbiconiux oxytropis TaxID=2970915 RepID=A0AA42BVM5_9MICO|nr:helix-turn-helix transcriptional regulator [Herbiconiux oxytropis]MCS5721709.1 helix-turn-helix transcriptional regulator [Herbiconiux oxytropis]MCS5726664.1 helix-turn-helix transcriptional regulator [Herbiconiux oxytropis]